MQGRRPIVCGLPAFGIKPQLHQQPRQDAKEDQGSDVEEITRLEYRRAMGYLIRVDENEEDIEPIFRTLVQNLRNHERNSASMRPPKQEQGESSRAKASR